VIGNQLGSTVTTRQKNDSITSTVNITASNVSTLEKLLEITNNYSNLTTVQKKSLTSAWQKNFKPLH